MKFIIGGVVITAVTVLANRLGGKIGGVLSGFPAIFVTVFVLEAWSNPGRGLDTLLITIVTASLGAILANMVTVWAAPRTLARLPFGVALLAMLTIWVATSAITSAVLPK